MKKKRKIVHYDSAPLAVYVACGLFIFTGDSKKPSHKTTRIKKEVTCRNCRRAKIFRGVKK